MTKGSDSSNDGGWYTRNERKRRLPIERVADGGGGGMRSMSSSPSTSNGIGKAMSMSLVNVDVEEDLAKKSSPPVDVHSIPSLSLPSSSAIPASLAPYLGWTKLSSSASCRRRRMQQRRKGLQRARRMMALSDLEDEEEDGYRMVNGRAIFFVHDPLLDKNNENDVPDGNDEDEEGNECNKIWFQGRFFPSAVSDGQIIEANNIMNNHHNTPVNNCIDSWGILAETGANDVDDCLLCPDGGYRILDLTFLRRAGNGKGVSVKEKYRRRWTARDLVWTGGNMMALTTEDYSLPLPSSMSMSKKKKNNSGSADHDQAPIVNFEPCKLVEGKPAIELAAKYFPLLVRRLQVRDMIEDGIGSGGRLEDVMVLIGNMQVSAPASFVAATSAVGDDDF